MNHEDALQWVAMELGREGQRKFVRLLDHESRINYRMDLVDYIEWLEIQLATQLKDSLRQIQAKQKKWQDYNFPDADEVLTFLGVVEEIGELAHHILKQKQGIRGGVDDHEAKIKDSIADAIIFLMAFCNKRDYDLQEIVTETWNEVEQRNWKTDPLRGGEIEDPIQEKKYHERKNKHNNG